MFSLVAQAIVMMKTTGVTCNDNIGFVMTYSFSVSYQWLIAKLWYHQFIETGDTTVMQYLYLFTPIPLRCLYDWSSAIEPTLRDMGETVYDQTAYKQNNT